ncbi:HAD family hydrolase [Kitasatospora sp. NPDC087861]|uniref:HAD family hydrolase n=1 Tax=Kitasatospora sp. NPDC087861 TaxID=3364070 RepID=UPI003811757A
MTKPKGVLFDLHGLFQIFDDRGAAEGESAAGLDPGTLARYAYQHPDYEAAKVGLMTDTEWALGVERRLVADCGEVARSAIGPWRADRGRPDPVMIDLLGQVMAAGTPCGVLSNFTDAMHADLHRHGITPDYAFSSADLGVAKPSPLAFREAAERMGIAPGDVCYFDDAITFVAGARAAGMQAELFTTAQACAHRLRTLGINVRLAHADLCETSRGFS